MKRLFTMLSFMIASNFASAQAVNKIEIRLKILTSTNKQGQEEHALGVSIINHSNEDIYIPNFELFASYEGVHFYQKENNIWREVIVDEHDYFKPIQTSNGKSSDHDEPVFYNDKNTLTEQYDKHIDQLTKHQDSLIKAFYNSAADHHGLSMAHLREERPLFLKAKQELDNYMVRSIDYLFTKKEECKISFNSEPRDTINYHRDSIVYSAHSKSYERLHYPDHIFEYHLFYPRKIISNTIYFTPKTIINMKP